MRNNKRTKQERIFICIGLLMVTVPTVVNDWVKVPDFFRGALMGLGLGLEIIGLVMTRKRRNQDLTRF